MIPASISRRWARALVELAQADDKLELICDQLQTLASAVESNAELAELVGNPSFDNKAQQAVFAKILDAMKADDLLRRFMRLVIEKDRLAALSGMARATQELSDQLFGRQRAHVVSAKPLSDEQRQALIKGLERRTGGGILLEEEVNDDLLAGLRVQLGGHRLEASVAGHFKQLERDLGVRSA